MKVQIIHEEGWMGNPPGSVVEVSGIQAKELVHRSIAKVVKDTPNKMVTGNKTITK